MQRTVVAAASAVVVVEESCSYCPAVAAEETCLLSSVYTSSTDYYPSVAETAAVEAFAVAFAASVAVAVVGSADQN